MTFPMEILKIGLQIKKYDFMAKINFKREFAKAGEINQYHKVMIISHNFAAGNKENIQHMRKVGFYPYTTNAYSDATTTGTVHAIN